MDMPMKKKRTIATQAAARGPLPEVPPELLDELVKGPMTPVEVQDLLLAFNKAIIERAMGAEMNMHLGYRPGQAKTPEQTNERHGASGKTNITEDRKNVVKGKSVSVRVEIGCPRNNKKKNQHKKTK